MQTQILATWKADKTKAGWIPLMRDYWRPKTSFEDAGRIRRSSTPRRQDKGDKKDKKEKKPVKQDTKGADRKEKKDKKGKKKEKTRPRQRQL